MAFLVSSCSPLIDANAPLSLILTINNMLDLRKKSNNVDLSQCFFIPNNWTSELFFHLFVQLGSTKSTNYPKDDDPINRQSESNDSPDNRNDSLVNNNDSPDKNNDNSPNINVEIRLHFPLKQQLFNYSLTHSMA